MMKKTIVFLSLIILAACGKKEKADYKPMNSELSYHEVRVEEVIQGGGYSYLSVRENEKQYWIAVGRGSFAKGQTLFFDQPMMMKDFESKELGRVFDEISFVNEVYPSLNAMKEKKKPAPGRRADAMKSMLDSIDIQPVEGGLSIAELYRDSKDIEGESVLVRGIVVKINENIMDRHWVHLMDGTRADRSDLTVTSTQSFQVGDTVVVKGKVTIDKDFGGGYVYPLILEEGVLVED